MKERLEKIEALANEVKAGAPEGSRTRQLADSMLMLSGVVRDLATALELHTDNSSLHIQHDDA